jgi:hypothetical protein
MSEITAITVHECFGAALDLFGRVWPALGPIAIITALWLVGAMVRELWRAVR